MGYRLRLYYHPVFHAGKEGIREMESNLSNSKVKDSSAKMIFGDAILCAQFLRGYVDIPLLKDVQPEDIEDVTERYVHMFTEERNSDIVKKVRIKKQEENDGTPFYLVSLIEHKSKVDYNVVMQIIRYMVFIWEDYEKEMDKQQEGISKTRDFRYPPVLPIVFYDGKESFTAATRLHDRILLSDVLGEYIPDYKCILVQLKDYSNAQLMEKKDELSIVMLIDRLQDMEGFAGIGREIGAEYLKEATAEAPGYLLDVIAQVMEVLLSKLNVPYEEAAEFTKQIKERRMGELLANFKGYDVQATRQEAREEERREWIERIKSLGQNYGSVEEIKRELLKGYSIDGDKAVKQQKQ